MAVHLCNVYGVPELRSELEEGFRRAGKKLDMGKGCIRVKELDDLPLDAIAATPMAAYVAFAKRAHSKEARAERSATRGRGPG
jgi:hypothetical protein